MHREGAHSDTWQCTVRLGQAYKHVLVVVGDVSGKPGDTVWGLGAVVVDICGCFLWEGQVWLDLQHGSTDVLEATAVVEACRAVMTALQQHRDAVDLVFAFYDNQGAATALAHRKITHWGGNG